MSFFRGAVCAVLSVTFLLLGGCAKPSPVGKWKSDQNIVPGADAKVYTALEFKPDGTMEQKIKTPNGEVSATGTYKLDGDKVALHLDKVKIGSVEGSVPADKAEQNATFKIEGDKMTVTRDGKSMDFMQVKE